MDDAFGHYNGEWYEDHRPPVNVSRIGTFDDLQARISEELVVTLLAPGSSDPVISALHDAISAVQDQGGLDAQVALQELRGRASPTDGQEFSRQLLRCGISPLVEVEVVTSAGGPRLRIAVNRLGLLGLPDLTGATAASRAFLADIEDRLCARGPGEPDERLTAVELDARWPTLRAGHLVTGLAPEAADGIIVSRPSEFASLETALASAHVGARAAVEEGQFVRALEPLSRPAGTDAADGFADSAEIAVRLCELAPFAAGEGFVRSLASQARPGLLASEDLTALFEDLRIALLRLVPESRPAVAGRSRIATMTLQVGGPGWVWSPSSDGTPNGSAESKVLDLCRASAVHHAVGGIGAYVPWDLPAHIVNAYYSIEANCVYVTDGLLRTLGLDLAATEPFGILGVLLAHEMSHALDGDSVVRDQGLDGSLPTAFPELREALSTQLGLTSTRYPGSMDIELVVDEALADLIGLRAALDALEQRGATDSDRGQFFANWAHLMRGRCSDEEGRRRLKVDPHPPLDVRCNLLADLPEFEAYCEASGVPLHEPPVATRRQVHAALREPSLILKGADTGY